MHYKSREEESEPTIAAYFDAKKDAGIPNGEGYAFLICKSDHEQNAVVEVYQYTRSPYEKTIGLCEYSGLEKIEMVPVLQDLCYTVDVWGKYFFVKQADERLQLYHGEHQLQVRAQAIEKAVELGLKEEGIEPY